MQTHGNEWSKGKVSTSKLKYDASRRDEYYQAIRNHKIKFAEAVDPNAERVRTPLKNDVLFGRGRGLQSHPGNKRLREIAKLYRSQYPSLPRRGKRLLVEKVYNELIKGGARFLIKVDHLDDAWVKVDVPLAHQKVMHTLRCTKHLIKKNERKFEDDTRLSSDDDIDHNIRQRQYESIVSSFIKSAEPSITESVAWKSRAPSRSSPSLIQKRSADIAPSALRSVKSPVTTDLSLPSLKNSTVFGSTHRRPLPLNAHDPLAKLGVLPLWNSSTADESLPLLMNPLAVPLDANPMTDPIVLRSLMNSRRAMSTNVPVSGPASMLGALSFDDLLAEFEVGRSFSRWGGLLAARNTMARRGITAGRIVGGYPVGRIDQHSIRLRQHQLRLELAELQSIGYGGTTSTRLQGPDVPTSDSTLSSAVIGSKNE
jgi:hypothetical protein